ncbi:cation transporter [Sphingosinicella xenopeptidilytica]|uniref:Cation transporter n=1 Tax=Sphingosinicella xenopeptidilytica TaxID=364098 RepID=A0ABW3BXF0_SPHXN
MAGGCCGCETKAPVVDKAWRRVLWIALAINAGMFAVEIAAGVAAHSASLKADALDFLGDSANYAISLGVAGMALEWRARAALLKGISLLLLGLWVLGTTVWMTFAGTLPKAETMGIVGVLALLANLACAVMLWRHRDGDANRRSVWICSRNDAIGNVAVVAAALGVFGTGTAWPDLAVAVILAGLGVSGGWQIIRQARSELKTGREPQAISIVSVGESCSTSASSASRETATQPCV